MTPAKEQFARVERFLARIDRQEASDEAADDLWCFFMNCWHLKDWIIHDPTIKIPAERVKTDVDSYESLRICADLANRTKHLVLTRPAREDAKVVGRQVQVFDGSPHEATARYTVELADGSTRDVHEVARDAVRDWRALLDNYGVTV
jgi:hypothetical protein